MESEPKPWLVHPEGYIVYRRYSAEDEAFIYNFSPTFDGGYFIWKSMVKLKGLKPEDFRNYGE